MFGNVNDKEILRRELFYLCWNAGNRQNEEEWNNLRGWWHLNKNNSARLKEAAAYRGDEMNRTPLHLPLYLCEPPVEVIEAFIEYTPEVLQIKTKLGSLPLHMVCRHCKSTKAVSLLVEAYPDGSTVADHEGFLPLHCACIYQASLEVLNLLLEAYPESINITSRAKQRSSNILKRRYGKKQCKFLLHKLCSGGYSYHLSKLALEAFPKSCMRRDEYGMVPLHHACANNDTDSVKIVTMLLDSFPQSYTVADNQGKPPLPSKIFQQAASIADKNGISSSAPPRSMLKRFSGELFEVFVRCVSRSYCIAR